MSLTDSVKVIMIKYLSKNQEEEATGDLDENLQSNVVL